MPVNFNAASSPFDVCIVTVSPMIKSGMAAMRSEVLSRRISPLSGGHAPL
jgi:hypothetical protein